MERYKPTAKVVGLSFEIAVMITTYRLHVNELSPQLLDSIKAAFKNKTVEIVVTDTKDESSYLLKNEANRRHIFDSIHELERGEGVELTVREFLEKYGTKQLEW